MKIHKEGQKVIPVAFFFIAVIDAIIYFTLKDYLIFYFLMAASLGLAVLVVYFFREPNRIIDKNEMHILAPADGEIVEILKVHETEYFKDERLQVSIFMSPFDVHQNRAPVEGKVVYSHHKKGVFYPAFVKKSSEKNERWSTVFKMKNGMEIMSRQIAGTVAQRIISYKKIGDEVEQGQEYGFIRFGSRVDLFLPTDSIINIQLHNKTISGKTIIALFK
jgi:phosphatidylserine decarboxylase